MNKSFVAIVVCFFAFLSVSCNKEKTIEVTSVSLSQATAEMIEGEVVQLYATVLPGDATDKTVNWASSKQSVATVSNTGKVTAVAEGSSTITASAGGILATCNVMVSKMVIDAASIELSRSEISIEEGQSITLVVTVKPDNATEKAVIWNSSDTSVATVDGGGTVTGIKNGKATITASLGGTQASCKVTVSKKVVSIESVSLNKCELTIEKGKSETLVATVKPEDATNKEVSWSSSDPNVASVDQDGKVTGIKGGETSITAKAGEKTATCKVSVVVPVENVSLNLTSGTIEVGKSMSLTASVIPEDATDKTVTWTSSNSAVADVSDSGVVSAKSKGTATITVKTHDGNKASNCTVTVIEAKVSVTGVSLDITSLTMNIGETQTLAVAVTPSNATDKSVTWSSSNSAIASVSSTGVVSAIAEGTATITVTTNDEGKTATCAVTVKEKSEKDMTPPALQSFTFSPETIDITSQSQEVTFYAHIYDETGLAGMPSIIIKSPQSSYSSSSNTMSRISGDEKDGEYSVTVTIPQGKEPGEWSVSMWPIEDKGGFSTGFLYPTSSKRTITVIMNNELDMTPPALQSFTFSPETIDITTQSQEVTFYAHFYDDTGLVGMPSIIIKSPQSSYSSSSNTMSRISGDEKDGEYSVTVTIPQGKEPGEWSVSMWPVEDKGGFSTGFLYPTSSKRTITVISN